MCWLKSSNVVFIVYSTILGIQYTAVNKMSKNPCPHITNSHSGGGGQMQ